MEISKEMVEKTLRVLDDLLSEINRKHAVQHWDEVNDVLIWFENGRRNE
ncbi:MAG: hypothetical protein QXL94_08235 [Candidatus Parvarchaeum sp.]